MERSMVSNRSRNRDRRERTEMTIETSTIKFLKHSVHVRTYPTHTDLLPCERLQLRHLPPYILLTMGILFAGKSEGGAIWLNSDRLSPFKFYQYLYNTPDADVIRFTKMLTFLPLDEVSALEQSMVRHTIKGHERTHRGYDENSITHTHILF